MKRRHFDLLLKGNIQGIGFRYCVKAEADRLCILGYIRNLRNGDVSLEIEGEETYLRKFIEWLKASPGFSKISSLEISVGKVEGFRVFSVY